MCLGWEDRPVVVERLARLIEDKEAFVRWNSALALGKIGHESGLKYLGKLVGDEHANVRFRATLALGLIGHENSIPVVEKMVYDTYEIGKHFVVRAFAAIALGMIPPQESSVRALAHLVQDEDPVVRWHVAVALGNVGLESGVEHLAKLIEDEIPFVRAHAAIALAQIGHESGMPYLERLTKDSTPRVAKIAQDSLELLRSLTSR
jgi:HEAT repeat protein